MPLGIHSGLLDHQNSTRYLVLTNAATPNSAMIVPASRLTYTIQAGVNFSRTKPTTVLKVSHQAA